MCHKVQWDRPHGRLDRHKIDAPNDRDQCPSHGSLGKDKWGSKDEHATGSRDPTEMSIDSIAHIHE